MEYIAVNSDKKEYDEFIKNHKYGQINQISSWANVKREWSSKRVLIKSGQETVGGALLLFRKVPFFRLNLCYIPRGPVCDYDDPKTVRKVLKCIIEEARKHKAFTVKIDPCVEIEKKWVIDELKSMGFTHKGLEKGLVYSQPRFLMITDIDKSEDEVLNSFQSRTKTAVKKSLKTGLKCEKTDVSEIGEFDRLMQITGERDKFQERDGDYLKNLLISLGDDAQLYLTRLNVGEVKKNAEKELSDIEKKTEKMCRNIEKDIPDEKKLNYKKELDVLEKRKERQKELLSQMERYISEGKRQINLSGAILTFCGRKSYYLYGASSNEFRDLLPNYLMQWTMMKDSIKRGCTSYDFGGVTGYTNGEDGDGAKGLYEFKKRFGSEMFETIGEFDFVLNKFVDRAFDVALDLRKKMMKKHSQRG